MQQWPDPIVSPAPVPSAPKRLNLRIVASAVVAVAALGAGVTALVVTGGSDSDQAALVEVSGETNDTEAFSFAAATEAVARAEAVQLDVSVDVDEMGADIAVTVDRISRRMIMSVSTRGDMGALDDIEMQMMLDAPVGRMYFNGGMFSGMLDVDSPWVAIDLDVMAASEDRPIDDYIDTFFASPLDVTSVFADYDPVDVGITEIDGETLREFHVTIDTASLTAENSDLFAGYGDVDVSAIDEITYRVFVTEQNLLRRMMLDEEIAGQSFRLDMSVDVLDRSVDISPPDPADVSDLSDFFAEMAGIVD